MTPVVSTACQLRRPATLGEAVSAIAQDGAVPIAGGTWVMRAPVRGEPFADTYVGLAGIPELHGLELSDQVRIGACVTHAELAAAIDGQPWLRGLALAAARSANPAVRRVATVGGNLSTSEFAAADLVPALLCLDAVLVLADGDGQRSVSLTEYLQARGTLSSQPLVTAVLVSRQELIGGHARLPLRTVGGDYPVAIVSVAVRSSAEGMIEHAAVAVGAVEPVARRWLDLEQALIGAPADPEHGAHAAEELAGGWSGRDDVDAPGWYRVKVLPALVRRALEGALAAADGRGSP